MAHGDPAIDARYAAQFQRGYDGPVAPPAVTTSAAHSTRSAPVRIPGGPPASVERVPDPPSAIERPEPTERAVDVDEPDDSPEPRSGIAEWGLLVASIVLLGLAALTFWMASTDISLYTNSYPSDRALMIETRNRLPGPLLVASAVAISTWVVVRAVTPGRARRPQ